MVRVDQDGVAALVAGEVLRGFEQLPAHALALELRQDVQGEFGQVEVVRERQRDVDGPDDLAADLGHEDDLAFVRVRHLQQFLQRRVGEVVAAPGLHAHPAAHFDGGNEVGGVRPVQRIGDPQLLNPYVVCHNGHHPQLFCHLHGYRISCRNRASTVSICRFAPAFHQRRAPDPPLPRRRRRRSAAIRRRTRRAGIRAPR